MKLARGGCCGVFEQKADDRMWQSIVWLGLVRRDALGCVLHLDRESGWDHALTLLYDLSLGIAKRARCWRSFLRSGGWNALRFTTSNTSKVLIGQ